MTEHHDDQLGRAMRDEVPAPGSDYWDAIDARLAQANADVDSIGNSPDPDTDATVVRLTDMSTTTPSNNRSPLLLGLAAAVVLLAGLAGAIAFVNNSPVEVDTAEQAFPDEASSLVPPTSGSSTMPPKTGHTVAPPVTGTPAITPTTVPPATAPVAKSPYLPGDERPPIELLAGVNYRCYVEENRPVDGSDEVWLFRFDGRDFAALLDRPDDLDPEVFVTSSSVGTGTVDTDGSAVVLTAPLVSLESTVGRWFFHEGVAATDAYFSVIEVACSNWAHLDDLKAQLDLHLNEVAAFEGLLGLAYAGPKRVATTGTSEDEFAVTKQPGDTESTAILGGGMNNLRATGRTAEDYGVGYTELVLPSSRFDGSGAGRDLGDLGWVRTDNLVASVSVSDVFAGGGSLRGYIDEVLPVDDQGFYGLVVEGETIWVDPELTVELFDGEHSETLELAIENRNLHAQRAVDLTVDNEGRITRLQMVTWGYAG